MIQYIMLGSEYRRNNMVYYEIMFYTDLRS